MKSEFQFLTHDSRLETIDYRWYTRKDSNLQFPVSKTGAFAVLATRAENWSGRQDLNLRILAPKASPCSRCGTPCCLKIWLREKDLNLYFLVQSQASCRLDDPEIDMAGKTGLEPATIGLKNRVLGALHSSPRLKIGKDGRIRTCNLLVRSEMLWFR